MTDIGYEKSFTSIELLNNYKSSSLSNYAYQDENINDYYCATQGGCTDPYLYNSTNKEYTPNEEYGAHGIGEATIYARYLKEYAYKDDIYTISYQYLWGYCSDTGCDYDAFTTYDDVISGKPIKSISKLNDDPADYNYLISESNKYLQENYDTLKNIIPTYKYSFKKINNEFKLVDFKVV